MTCKISILTLSQAVQVLNPASQIIVNSLAGVLNNSEFEASLSYFVRVRDALTKSYFIRTPNGYMG